MTVQEVGAPPESRAPETRERGLNSTLSNTSAFGSTCKPLDPTIFSQYDRKGIEAYLQAYLDLGLTPIPLAGKRPVVKWLHGDWHPKSMKDFSKHLCWNNWGLRTGGDFAVIDFDTTIAYYQFMAENIERLPSNTPIVRTGRGYHIWFRPTEPVRDMHFEGIDIKGIGGQVVAPPSIHAKTGRPYAFIRPPKGDIPTIDLNTLDFPSLKRREASSKGNDKGKGGGNTVKSAAGTHTDKPRFNYDNIKDGVEEGGRHTALVSYIGHLIWRRISKEEILVLITSWNSKNRPPLTEAEVTGTLDYCYASYAPKKTASALVPTKTLQSLNSVIVETEPYPRISRWQPLYTPDSPTPNSWGPEDAWEVEPERNSGLTECGKRRAVVRRGREYMSVSFFCGKWSCPRCGPYFRQRWISHMLEKTKDTDLYVTEIDQNNWSRVRRSINRLDADYMKIKVGGMLRIITDKPLENSTELAQEDIQTYLESSIPQTAPKNPISTSRNWQHHKKEKSSDYEAVTITWLPVKDQVEVAVELGASMVKRTRWLSPEDADDEEWAENFKEGIKAREKLVNWWLKHPTGKLDMREYLNRQYVEDAIYDECGEGDFIDKMLVEAS